MNIGVTELLLLLAIVVLLFGTARLRTLGSDLGGSIRGFRKAIGATAEPATEAGVEKGPERQKAE